MKGYIDDFPTLESIAEALEASDCPMNQDEKIRIMDLIIGQSIKREASARNPQSFLYVFYPWRDRENPIPKWCEAQKEIIKSLHYPSTKGAAAPSKHTEPNFSHLILMNKPDVLMNALRNFIEADGRKASEIGAMFFRCRLLKYISNNPTEAEAKSAFKIYTNWSGVQNYMPKYVNARNYDAAFNLAERLKLLENEPDELPY